MASSVTSPSDLVNLALGRIGAKGRVGSLYEGSAAAKIALDLYSQTRDALLREGDFGFAEQNVNLTLLKQAPATGYFPPNNWDGTQNPPPPWVFSYGYPDSCLKVRAVKQAPLFVMNFDPQPNVFAIENDNYYTPSRKVILCNIPNAMAVITGQVTDPTVWEADFTEFFTAALARRLAPALATMDIAKFEVAEEAQAKVMDDQTEG